MNIALVGVPNMGKSEYAQQLAKENELVILDNIPQTFSESTGLAIGPFHDYMVDLFLASERLKMEYIHQKVDFVSTTTILDSLIYITYFMANNSALDIAHQVEYAASTIATMVWRHWNYDQAFFFRYHGDSERWLEIDRGYKAIFETIGIPYETIDRPGNEATSKSLPTI